MKMYFPEQLNQGDCVALIAPSSPVSPERVEVCAEVLKNLGYQVLVGESCYCSLHGYLAGSDDIRAGDINRMFALPQIKGIFCIRGGYGSGRIMGKIDYELIRTHPKVFVGYSDITNLNAAFGTLCNMVTFHGPMVSSNMVEHYDEFTRNSFESVMNMQEILEYQNPNGEELKIISEGAAKGTLVGGNLALLVNMLGTFYAPDFKDKILFIEDISESVPRIERMLMQFKHLHIFDEVSGILIGDFSETNSNEIDFTVEELIEEFFSGLKKPIVSNLKCGHCFPMATLPLGAECGIDTRLKKIIFYKN